MPMKPWTSGRSHCAGTEWSDGKPLTSDDVVFTINMLKEYAPQLNWSGAVKQWVESVEAVDDRTIKFTLTESNPRFVMENLAGTTSQAIVPAAQAYLGRGRTRLPSGTSSTRRPARPSSAALTS